MQAGLKVCPRDGTTERTPGGECRACVRKRQREWKRRKYDRSPRYRLQCAQYNTLYKARKQVERADELRERLDAKLSLQG